MVRLRKNTKRFWAYTSPTPVSAPLHVPLSSMEHSPYNNPSQNLIHLSPSVFTPHSPPLQFHSISQPAHILCSSDPSQASFQNLGSAPPPVYTPHFTPSLSAHHLIQPFQNLSLAPPPGFNSHFAHSQPQYTPQPSIIFASGNMGFRSPTSEDNDDMKIEVDLPPGESMDVDSVDEVMHDLDDTSTHIRTSPMLKNHFGICTSLPYPLIAQPHPTVPADDSQPALYPETYHPLCQLPTAYDDLHALNTSPELSVIDTAHINALHSPTTFYPSCNEKEITLGCPINDAAFVRPAHQLDHPSLREFEEQAALKWFAEEIARVPSINSRPHPCFEPSINATDLPAHSSALSLPPGPRRGITAVEDAARWMQRKHVLSCQQSYLTQILLGKTTSEVKDRNTVQRSLPMRRSGSARHRNSSSSPFLNNSSRSFCGKVVEKAQRANDDRQMKGLRVAAQVVPTTILKVSASVLKVPAAIFTDITSMVTRTCLALTKGLKSAAGKIISSMPRVKPLPEVIVIDDD